ncbi:minor capsid protein [Arthrobacter sp. SLBN-83]|uniref:hypothetical protein n=1 Tax=Arthrobacter sp. SLBN-83 TaxID=2768449 RepID=UPI001151A602|nr:hypothetical protein [Arthrobacter sp. SLBN-83]TQJ60482.1 minor capsid protein [Arthrobacter sp. SLBN-83]
MSKDWNLHLNGQVDESLKRAANRGLALAAEHVLGESNKTVPIEEATLERSGTTSTDKSRLRAAVSYDTPYAVKQHEDLTLRHDAGRSAKYLENALNSEVPAVREIIAQTIKGDL